MYSCCVHYAALKRKKVSFEVMKVEKGKAVGTGEFIKVPADILINANRQEADTAFLRSVNNIQLNDDGTVRINAQRMTGHEGIFAGGDMLPGENRRAPPSPWDMARRPPATSTVSSADSPMKKERNIPLPASASCTCGTKPMPRRKKTE